MKILIIAVIVWQSIIGGEYARVALRRRENEQVCALVGLLLQVITLGLLISMI